MFAALSRRGDLPAARRARQDWLLPGLEHVPPNAITGVEPDVAFIEAYLLGLNHEMGRELLWRIPDG